MWVIALVPVLLIAAGIAALFTRATALDRALDRIRTSVDWRVFP